MSPTLTDPPAHTGDSLDLSSPAGQAFLRGLLAPLWKYACRVCRNPADAEDVVQLILGVRLVEKWSALQDRTPGGVRAWLFGAVHQESLDHRRDLKRRRECALEAVEWATCQPTSCPFEDDDRQALAAAFDALTDDDRDILLLKHEAGLSHATIAELFDITEDTSKMRLFYARARLRSEIVSRSTELAARIDRRQPVTT